MFLGGLQLYKKETLEQAFSCEFCEISKNTFLHRTPLMAAFVVIFFSKGELENNKKWKWNENQWQILALGAPDQNVLGVVKILKLQ